MPSLRCDIEGRGPASLRLVDARARLGRLAAQRGDRDPATGVGGLDVLGPAARALRCSSTLPLISLEIEAGRRPPSAGTSPPRCVSLLSPPLLPEQEKELRTRLTTSSP